MAAIVVFALFMGIGSLFGEDNIGIFTLIGAIIAFIFLIIFALIMPGYGISVMKEGINRSGTIPPFEIGNNIVNTIKLAILSIIYFIIPTIIIFLLFLLVGVIGSATQSIATLFPFIIVIIVAVLLVIAFEFLLAIATLRLANYGSFSKALNFGEVIEDLKQIGILKTAIVWVVIFVIEALISTASVALVYSFIGIFAVPIIIMPFTVLFSSYAMGLLYSDIA